MSATPPEEDGAHECAYDTPGAGPCVTCLTAAQSAEHDALLEKGRRLASMRDDLIAQGVDPTELKVPLAPIEASDQ